MRIEFEPHKSVLYLNMPSHFKNYSDNESKAKNIADCISSLGGGSNITVEKLVKYIHLILKQANEDVEDNERIYSWALVDSCGETFYTTNETPAQAAKMIIQKVKDYLGRDDDSLEVTQDELVKTLLFFGNRGRGQSARGPFKEIY